MYTMTEGDVVKVLTHADGRLVEHGHAVQHVYSKVNRLVSGVNKQGHIFIHGMYGYNHCDEPQYYGLIWREL